MVESKFLRAFGNQFNFKYKEFEFPIASLQVVFCINQYHIVHLYRFKLQIFSITIIFFHNLAYLILFSF